MVEDLLRDADPARAGERLYPRGDVHPVADYVAPVLQDVSDVDADPQEDLPVGSGRGVPLLQALLDLHGALRSLDGARELDEEAVAHRLDLGPDALPDGGADDLPLLVEELDREGLVLLGDLGVSDDVSEHYRRQLSAWGLSGPRLAHNGDLAAFEELQPLPGGVVGLPSHQPHPHRVLYRLPLLLGPKVQDAV